MARHSQSIHELREAIEELNLVAKSLVDNFGGTTSIANVVLILVNALEAIEREFTTEEEGR